MKKDKGSLTIEASLVLFIFVLALLFFMSFAKYSAVQNKVKHSLNQTAISMSLRNYQLSHFWKITKSTFGIDQDVLAYIAEIIDAFSSDYNKSKDTLVKTLGYPYTDTYTDINHNVSPQWSEENMKLEVMRFFAHYYLDDDKFSFKNTDGMSYDEIKERLDQAGLADVEIIGGIEKTVELDKKGDLTMTNHFVKGKELTIKIKYKIRTGMSFGSIFGFDSEPEFEDSISAKLFK